MSVPVSVFPADSNERSWLRMMMLPLCGRVIILNTDNILILESQEVSRQDLGAKPMTALGDLLIHPIRLRVVQAIAVKVKPNQVAGARSTDGNSLGRRRARVDGARRPSIAAVSATRAVLVYGVAAEVRFELHMF